MTRVLVDKMPDGNCISCELIKVCKWANMGSGDTRYCNDLFVTFKDYIKNGIVREIKYGSAGEYTIDISELKNGDIIIVKYSDSNQYVGDNINVGVVVNELIYYDDGAFDTVEDIENNIESVPHDYEWMKVIQADRQEGNTRNMEFGLHTVRNYFDEESQFHKVAIDHLKYVKFGVINIG